MQEAMQLSYQLNPWSIQRRNILQVCRFAVKSLIDKTCYETIDPHCSEMINFLAVMEKLLNHRLKPHQTWYGLEGPRNFWDYIQVACRKVPHNCLPTIQSIETLKTTRGKGRAWLRAVLMEKRLSEYIAVALSQHKITRTFYQEGSVMLSEEASMLSGILLGLNAIDFSFDLKGETLDYGHFEVDYTPYLKFHQSVDSLNNMQLEFEPESSNAACDSVDDNEAWRRKYFITEAKYRTVCEQKGYLEELVRLRESQLDEVHKQRQKLIETMQYYESESRRERQQLESVIIELQAQMTGLKEEHRQQCRQMELHLQRFSSLSSSLHVRESNIPMQDLSMAPRPTTIGHVDGIDKEQRDKLTEALSNDNNCNTADCKSILSNGSTQSAVNREETQSMVLMTGSFTSDSLSVRSSDTPFHQSASEQTTQATYSPNQDKEDVQPITVTTPGHEIESSQSQHTLPDSLNGNGVDEGALSDEKNASTCSSDNGFEMIHQEVEYPQQENENQGDSINESAVQN